MPIPINLLRQLRGETSKPLISELERLLATGETKNKEFLAIQVNSDKVVRGLSLIVRISNDPTAWIYISRKEIPGYLPIRAIVKLNAAGWFIANDMHGEEFAFAWKRFPNYDLSSASTSIASALEALGAPQKHSWELEAVYL